MATMGEKMSTLECHGSSSVCSSYEPNSAGSWLGSLGHIT